eukprot:9902224-Alexandrium_andersonii.AAC.1
MKTEIPSLRSTRAAILRVVQHQAPQSGSASNSSWSDDYSASHVIGLRQIARMRLHLGWPRTESRAELRYTLGW